MIPELVARAFIIFGVAHMFVNTHGPFDVFKHIKRLAGVNYVAEFDGYGQKIGEVEEPTNVVANMLTCFYCLSFWLCLWWVFDGLWRDAFIIYGVSSFLYRVSDGKIRS